MINFSSEYLILLDIQTLMHIKANIIRSGSLISWITTWPTAKIDLIDIYIETSNVSMEPQSDLRNFISFLKYF